MPQSRWDVAEWRPLLRELKVMLAKRISRERSELSCSCGDAAGTMWHLHLRSSDWVAVLVRVFKFGQLSFNKIRLGDSRI